MKSQTVIIIVILVIAAIIIYIKVIKPSLTDLNTVAQTSGKANSILNIFGL